MTDKLGHLDSTDRPCERHPTDVDALLQLAAIGSRTASFNHDIASKIQGVMMAIDEIAELASAPDLKLAAEAAHSALAELNQMLQQNRVLTKPPVIERVTLHDLVVRGAMRSGVTLKGARAACEVEVAAPLLTQALAIMFDMAAGLERRRSLELGVAIAADRVELTFPLATGAVVTGDMLAIVAWIVARDRGELRCSDRAISIRLPALK